MIETVVFEKVDEKKKCYQFSYQWFSQMYFKKHILDIRQYNSYKKLMGFKWKKQNKIK